VVPWCCGCLFVGGRKVANHVLLAAIEKREGGEYEIAFTYSTMVYSINVLSFGFMHGIFYFLFLFINKEEFVGFSDQNK